MSYKMMIVDRIINGIAVCENDGSMMDIPLSAITGNVREGDVLRVDKNDAQYIVDTDETQKRRDAITERFERIKARNKKS